MPVLTSQPQRPSAWLGIELRHLAALQAVAEHESFVRAARALGYTQSAISQQIATLERVVGERLVDRPGGPRRVALTDAGRLLLDHASAIIARLAAAEADMQALSRGERGVLRLGAYQSVGSRVLPVLMRRFLRQSASGDLRLTESIADPELLHLVAQGGLDLAFAGLPLPEGPFVAQEVLADPFVLVVDRASPLGERSQSRELELADLDGEDVACFETCRGTEAAFAELAALRIAPNVVFRSDHASTVQGLAAAGIGAALIPRLAFDSSDPYTVAIDVGRLLPPRRIALVWHDQARLSPIALAFVQVAQEVCPAIARGEAQRVAAGRPRSEAEAVFQARLRDFPRHGSASLRAVAAPGDESSAARRLRSARG